MDESKLLRMGDFAQTIMEQRYSWTKGDGAKETMPEIGQRVAKHVMKSVDAPKALTNEVARLIGLRIFIPGGRYLFASGRPYHQTQNCLLLRAEDSREGWADIMHKSSMALMTGAGIGVNYSLVRAKGKPIRKTGGVATGPLALIQMVNEAGRGIRQGGTRRSAIWGGLSWCHPDIFEFITIKNWSKEVRSLKEKDYDFPATLDGTNISVCLDDGFFEAYHDEKHALHSMARNVYWATVRQMLKTGEPGFSIDTGKHAKENLRNACQPEWATVLTPDGIRRFKDIDVGSVIWSGTRWTKVVKKWSTGEKTVYGYGTRAGVFYGTDNHRIISNGERVEAAKAETIDTAQGPPVTRLVLNPQDVMDGLVIGDGTVHKASNNLVLLNIGAKDTDYLQSEVAGLIGRHRSGISDHDWEITTTVTHQELPKTYNREIPARYYHSPSKMAAFLRGLFSANGSIAGNRVTLKASSLKVIQGAQEMLSALGIRSYYTVNTAKDITFSNGTYRCKESYDLNITGDRDKYRKLIGFLQVYKQQALDRVCGEVTRNNAPKTSYEVMEVWDMGVHEVYEITVEADEHTYWTGGMLVSNCTEVCSADDSDICNLGSINMARIESLEQMRHVTEVATAFLLAGTVYSDVPYPKVDAVRTKNRRLGLGLMGIHEWLLLNGKKYEPNDDLAEYLKIYQEVSDSASAQYADEWELSRPAGRRALAPNGTTGIVGETTTGMEPMLYVAYKRSYMKGDARVWQYVIDPAAKRLVEMGADPDDLEDAYTLAEQPERRVEMQAWLQSYVDHGISSTINLPSWGSDFNNDSRVQDFGNMLIKYLPKLRGITVYPDGARGGQPLQAVSYRTAMKHVGKEFSLETGDVCDLSHGGTCGL